MDWHVATTFASAIAVFLVYVGLHSAWRSYRRTVTLRHAAAALTDAVVDADKGIVTGRVGGRTVRCELTSRGSGSSSTAWTEVSIETDETTLELELWPQTLVEEIDLERGMAIDVATGDPVFDRAFIVEGAPTAAVREVLSDAELRRALVALGAIDVSQSGSGTTLMLAKKGWVWGEKLATMATTAGALAARMAVVAAKMSSAERDAYRGARTDPAAEQDRQALAVARAKRERKWSAAGIGVAISVALFVLAWLAAIVAPK